MLKLKVNLQARSYPIFTGVNLNNIPLYCKKQNFANKIFIVTNTTVNKLYLKELSSSFEKNGFNVFSVILPDGEKYKVLDTVKKIYLKAFNARLDRHSTIIALGGGVIGDMAGFAAGTYLRGINFVQMPTTLLSMVDSSVGGKTGFDMAEGKNLIGVFYQPKVVWIDTETLKTLPQRQWRNGLAEVIKYGVILSKDFFKFLEKELLSTQKISSIDKIVQKCCMLKAKIVEQDEFEQKGVREVLNFGHTFGHAIETITEYKKYCHGEAVAIGMIKAGRLAVKMGIFSQLEQDRLEKIISNTGLPLITKEKISADKMIKVMMRDKKSLNNKLRFVLPEKIGSVKVYSDVPVNLVKEVLNG